MPSTEMNKLIPVHERPLCECHGEPMHAHYKWWRCAVIGREQALLYAKNNPEKKRLNKARWNERNPDKIRAQSLKQSVGISVEEYDRLFAIQHGVCGICGSKPGERGGPRRRNLSVDHNHETGEVRGLLCHNCNTGLGFFSDNLGLLEQAIRYMKAGK